MVSPFDDVKTAHIGSATLAYRERGEGQPVILIHGSASDLRNWDHQLDPIGERFRAIAYSRRYARPNEDIEPSADDQMLPHVEDLTAFQRAVDAYPAHLIGHSWGGFVALLAAIRHPDAVRSLVLLEPPVVPLFVSTPPRPGELLRLFITRPATAAAILTFGATALAPAQKAFRRGDEEAALRAFGQGVMGKEHYGRMSEARIQQTWENRRSARAQLMGEGFPPLRDAEVKHVTAPALLLVGEESPRFMRDLSARLHELLPRSERFDIAGASHLMQEENPARVNELILGFLARQSRT